MERRKGKVAATSRGCPGEGATELRNKVRLLERARENERRQAQEALRESEERLELAVSAMTGGFWELPMDPEDPARVPDRIRLSPQLKAAIGYGDDEFPDSLAAWQARMHPEDLPQVTRAALAYLETDAAAFEAEYRIRHRDGSWRWILCRGKVVRDERGRPVRWAGIDLDITRRKHLEEELQHAKERAEEGNRAKSEFLAGISHELRTPMTVFMAAIDILQQLDTSPERRELLELADASAHRLLNVIEDILDMSRIEARRLEVRSEAFEVRPCVRKTAALFALPAQKKGLRLAVEIAPGVPERVWGDPERLGQVLMNLLGNAVKFTERGEIVLSVRVDRQSLHFAVRDTGIGIPEEKQDRLFRSFTQVDGSLTRRFGGSGLGLAISKGLVDLMGGRIEAQSREGEGSVFSFTLPLPDPPATAAAPEATGAGEATGEEGVRVLVAEDDPAIRKLLSILLDRRGWRIVTAESGREAVAKWQDGGIDVILMDMQMPDIDGLEATRLIRRMEGERAHTCIIALTGHARRNDQAACLSAGMDGFLPKPVGSRPLYAAIERCLLH